MRLKLKLDSIKEKKFNGIVIIILFSILFCFFYNSILFSEKYIFFDGLIPAYLEIKNWSNDLFSGYPLIADPIWTTFYPLRLIFYKILHLNFNFFVIFGYFLMAVFTYAYVYLLIETIIPAFVSAIIFSFSGYAIFEIGHAINFVHTICWLPLILFAFEKLKTNFNYFWFLIAVLAITMTVFGGFPQIALAICFILLTYSILISYQKKNKLKNFCFYLAMIGCGYLLAAPLIIPTFLLSLHSTRSHLIWEVFSSYYVEWKQLLLFYFPYLMGGYYGPYAKIPFFGNWECIGNHGFVGFLTIIFAGIAILKSPHYLKSTVIYWFLMSLLSVLIALGPEIDFFYRFLFHIPLVNNFRAPERYLFIFSFGMSVLAAIGIQTIRQGLIHSKNQKFLIFIASLIFAGYLILLAYKMYPSLQQAALDKLPSFFKNPAVMVPFGWMVLSLISLGYWFKKQNSQKACLGVSCVLIMELLYTAYFSYWHPSQSFWSEDQLINPPSFLNKLKMNLNETHQRYLQMQLSGDPVGRYLWGNLAMYYHLPSAGGYTPLALHRYLDFLQIADYGSYIGDPNQFENNQAINIAGIKYLTTLPGPFNELWFKNKAHFKLHDKAGDLLVYENLQVLPRAWFTSRTVSLAPNELLQVIHTGKFSNGELFDPLATALIEQPQRFKFEQDKSAKVFIEKIKNSEVLIKTLSQQPQFLVLADVYYPGWQAYIDGKKTTIFLTDYIYRGLIVPAGVHQVLFKYQPSYLYLGYLMSFLTLGGLIILFFRLNFSANPGRR